jgi:chromosome segregation ATPase
MVKLMSVTGFRKRATATRRALENYMTERNYLINALKIAQKRIPQLIQELAALEASLPKMQERIEGLALTIATYDKQTTKTRKAAQKASKAADLRTKILELEREIREFKGT